MSLTEPKRGPKAECDTVLRYFKLFFEEEVMRQENLPELEIGQRTALPHAETRRYSTWQLARKQPLQWQVACVAALCTDNLSILRQATAALKQVRVTCFPDHGLSACKSRSKLDATTQTITHEHV